MTEENVAITQGEGELSAEDITPPDQELETSEDTTPEADKPAEKSGLQRRIDELTRKRREAEREAAYWRGVAEAKVTNSDPDNIQNRNNDFGLDPNDFDSDTEYLKAVAAKIKEDLLKEQENRIRAEKERTTQALVLEKYEEARRKHSDFDEVALNPSLPITQHMFDAAIGDSLADVLYYLGKNPAEANRISSLSPTQQVKEIGKIEARLTNKTITKAPPPPSNINTGGSSGPPKKEEEMTRAELHAKWERERRARLGIRS